MIRNSRESITSQGNLQIETTASEQNRGNGFFQTCLAKSRGSTPEERYLWRTGVYDAIRDVIARQLEYRADVPVGRSEPSGILPTFSGPSADRGEHESTLCHSGDCIGTSKTVRIPAYHGGTAATWAGGEPQAGRTDDAGGQPPGDPELNG